MDFACDFKNGVFKRDARGGIDLVSDQAAIAQAIEIKLSVYKGEIITDRDKGVPYLSNVLVKAPNLSVIQQILKARIETVEGVLSVTQFDLALDNATRKLKGTFTALTSAGLITAPISL